MIKGIEPNWQVSAKVRGLTTFRSGGVSVAPFQSLNLGMHVGDDPAAVLSNRQLLVEQLQLPSSPRWLNQTHGTTVVSVTDEAFNQLPNADASYTKVKNQVLAIMTADCLPLFIASADATEIALVHCGWRSLANGIIEQTLLRFSSPVNRLHAWLGPAIGPNNFTVGDDVKVAMLKLSPNFGVYFKTYQDRWLLDLFGLVTAELSRFGLSNTTSSNMCTVEHQSQYFSYRRDGQTGRMVSLLWLEP